MDPNQILADIADVLKGELKSGYTTIKSFVESQGKLLAKQAATIARSRVSGSLKDDDELYEFFLESLRQNTENMAKSIAMLTALTIEKAWNAVANVLWGAIRTVLSGAGVPSGLLPAVPPLSI